MNGVVSFVRDPRSKNNDEHTFIVIEAMNKWGRLTFYRFELATHNNNG